MWRCAVLPVAALEGVWVTECSSTTFSWCLLCTCRQSFSLPHHYFLNQFIPIFWS
jgi:hypothetical protein